MPKIVAHESRRDCGSATKATGHADQLDNQHLTVRRYFYLADTFELSTACRTARGSRTDRRLAIGSSAFAIVLSRLTLLNSDFRSPTKVQLAMETAMTDHVEFLSRYPRRPGKLAAWQADIVGLLNGGASYRLVCLFLAEQGVTADPSEVWRFMHRCGRQRFISGSPSHPAPAKSQAKTVASGLPKFEWDPDKPRDSNW